MEKPGLRANLGKTGFWIIVFVIIYIISGIITLKNYSISWDEGLGNLFFGERYLHYFATRNPVYLNFKEPDLPIHQRVPNLFDSPWRNRPYEFPPFADTASALSTEALAFRLGIMDPIDAFHLPKILMSGLLLGVLYWFAAPRMGKFAAFLGILTLGLYPRFWGDMHFNPKDIPITALFSFVLILFYYWYQSPSWLKTIGIGLLSGAALSIKANAVFIPVVIILGVWPWQWRWSPWGPVINHLKKRYRDYFVMVIIALSIHLISWPYLYADPLRRIYRYYRYIFSQGERGGIGVWNLDPLMQTFASMPVVIILLLGAGLCFAILQVAKGKERTFFQLLLVWIVVPIFRSSLPSAQNFDGIRHFLEFLPAACLLAGFGAGRITKYLTQWKPNYRSIWSFIIAALLLTNLLIAHWVYNPYQYIYFNSLVGGLHGARTRLNIPGTTDYWTVSYRQGIEWLNDNAESEAKVSAPIAQWNFKLVAPLWMRPDLGYISRKRVDEYLADGDTVYLMYITREGFYTPIIHDCQENQTIVHQIIVDRVPILEICKLEMQ